MGQRVIYPISLWHVACVSAQHHKTYLQIGHLETKVHHTLSAECVELDRILQRLIEFDSSSDVEDNIDPVTQQLCVALAQPNLMLVDVTGDADELFENFGKLFTDFFKHFVLLELFEALCGGEAALGSH